MSLRNVRDWLGGGRRIRALARTENRGRLHATLLLLGAALVMLASLALDLFDDPPPAIDKARPYHTGRVLAAVIFYFAYAIIILRLLVAGRVRGSLLRGSLRRRLLLIPMVLAGGILVALLGVLGLSMMEESFDFAGTNDLEIGISSAVSLVLPVALIVALTPILFIPLDLFLKFLRLSRRRLHRGTAPRNGDLETPKSPRHLEEPADVMVVEDDLVAATTVINFCRNLDLKCHHVSTIDEAGFHLRNNLSHLRLIILDNFLRIGDTGDNTTGSQWLSCISREFPPDSRTFRVVIISGYPDYLGDAAPLADLVLKKPWSPEDLTEFMARHEIGQIPIADTPMSGGSPSSGRKRVRRYYSRRRTHHQPAVPGPPDKGPPESPVRSEPAGDILQPSSDNRSQ